MMDDEQPQQDNRAQLHLTARGPRKDERGHPTGAKHAQSLRHRSRSPFLAVVHRMPRIAPSKTLILAPRQRPHIREMTKTCNTTVTIEVIRPPGNTFITCSRCGGGLPGCGRRETWLPVRRQRYADPRGSTVTPWFVRWTAWGVTRTEVRSWATANTASTSVKGWS